MVKADNEMRASMVLADDCVPKCFAPSTHAHGEVQQGQCGGLLRVVAQQLFAAAHARVVIDVTGLGQANKRADQQVGLGNLGGSKRQFQMRDASDFESGRRQCGSIPVLRTARAFPPAMSAGARNRSEAAVPGHAVFRLNRPDGCGPAKS